MIGGFYDIIGDVNKIIVILNILYIIQSRNYSNQQCNKETIKL